MKDNTLVKDTLTKGKITAMLAGFCEIIENEDFELIQNPSVTDQSGTTWHKARLKYQQKSKKWTILNLRISDEEFPSIHIDSCHNPDSLLTVEKEERIKEHTERLSNTTVIHTGKRGRPRKIREDTVKDPVDETVNETIWDFSDVIDDKGNFID